MATNDKNILKKMYFVAFIMTILFIVIFWKIFNIQITNGEAYRKLSEKVTLRNDTIFPNRGNVYSADGTLLATSMYKYDIRMDAISVDEELFEKHIGGLATELSKMLGKTPYHYENYIRKARINKNRYLLIARNLGHNEYVRMRNFPIFNKGVYKGGFIAEQRTVRAHPVGKVAERTIGYDDDRGRVGVEGAYSEFLDGKIGWRMKQKIAKGLWKPINDNNEVEPIDGKDVVTTIDLNIQDIAHHALLEQLEKYQADHGCVVVMETKTGEIKAISNLGKSKLNTYYESRNYAIFEAHEPGSTFKLMSLIVALEGKVIDTSTVVDTDQGIISIRGRKIRDSHKGGYGKISAAKVIEVSSNVGIVKLIMEHYGKNPKKFADKLYEMKLNETLNLEIKGEGKPEIPHPSDKNWSALSLPWMAYGYGLHITPLQTLTFYNAIANNGEMVKPRFIKEVRVANQIVEKFNKQIIHPKICSQETVDKVQTILENTVKRGTAKSIYSSEFSMAGKTGTTQLEYWTENTKYISTFVGYFPAKNPKYSCIVVINSPDKSLGYYGGLVSAPVFQKIAQKIHTITPKTTIYNNSKSSFALLEDDYQKYYTSQNTLSNQMPDVVGMSVMDAVSMLENLGLNVQFNGNGKVKAQSVKQGEPIKKGLKVALNVS
ncbi:MAG: penicillin-binding protein [Flavobacteriaceae bacterium]|nr:penicillin-binding protein [Flavobacteriaceae bacterium]